MVNIVLSIGAGIIVFVVACFVALQVAPNRRGTAASCVRIGASCLTAILIAAALYVYLEG